MEGIGGGAKVPLKSTPLAANEMAYGCEALAKKIKNQSAESFCKSLQKLELD